MADKNTPATFVPDSIAVETIPVPQPGAAAFADITSANGQLLKRLEVYVPGELLEDFCAKYPDGVQMILDQKAHPDNVSNQQIPAILACKTGTLVR